MKLIDTHCHLYLKEFKNDLDTMMQRARNAGVTRFYLPSIDSTVVEDMLELERVYKGECFPMMGLHPCSVNTDYKTELNFVETWLAKRKFVAIGEIGLDFYWDNTFVAEQYQAFTRQMELALQYHLPIVIHSRNATQESIDAVKPFSEKGVTGNFSLFWRQCAHGKTNYRYGFFIRYWRSGNVQKIGACRNAERH